MAPAYKKEIQVLIMARVQTPLSPFKIAGLFIIGQIKLKWGLQ
jgi:hypothetical protein